MKTKLLLATMALSIIGFAACKNHEKTSGSADKTQKMQQNNTYSLVVSFISIGQGVDQKAIEQYNEFIAQFEKENNVKINLEKVPWGREGEVDYCIDLTGLDKKTAEKFSTKTEELLSKNNLVKVEKNAPCVHKR